MKKILISEVKDAEGVKIIMPLKDKVDWENLEDEVNTRLEFGDRTASVKFYLRTQKWLDKIPEYEG